MYYIISKEKDFERDFELNICIIHNLLVAQRLAKRLNGKVVMKDNKILNSLSEKDRIFLSKNGFFD